MGRAVGSALAARHHAVQAHRIAGFGACAACGHARVHVADPLQVPPEQLELPIRVVDPPFGPVKDCDEPQAPLAQEP